MSRIAFFVAGRPVYWYGILIAAALLAGTLLVMAREKRFGLQKDDSLNFVLWAAPVAIVCARLYYVAFSWDAYKDDLTKVFALREGGLAIYGAVLGGLLTAVVFAKKKRIPLGSLCDLCAPALVLGQAIGRWGNFFNQEAFGRAITDPSLQFFPMGVYIEALGEWHWAAFFYESCWCALIFLFLMWGEHRRCFRRAGDEFMAYAVLYAAERCVVEGLRTDSLMLMGVRVSQLLSLGAMLLFAVVLLARGPKKGLKWFIPLLLSLGALLFAVRAGRFFPQLAASAVSLALFAPLYRATVSPKDMTQEKSD